MPRATRLRSTGSLATCLKPSTRLLPALFCPDSGRSFTVQSSLRIVTTVMICATVVSQNPPATPMNGISNTPSAGPVAPGHVCAAVSRATAFGNCFLSTTSATIAKCPGRPNDWTTPLTIDDTMKCHH